MLHKPALLNQVVACTVEHKYDLSSSLTRGTALSSHNCHSGCTCGREKGTTKGVELLNGNKLRGICISNCFQAEIYMTPVWGTCGLIDRPLGEKAAVDALDRQELVPLLTRDLLPSAFEVGGGRVQLASRLSTGGPSRMNKAASLMSSSLAHCCGHANIHEKRERGHTKHAYERQSRGYTLHEHVFVLVHVQTQRGGMWPWKGFVSRSSSSSPPEPRCPPAGAD